MSENLQNQNKIFGKSLEEITADWFDGLPIKRVHGLIKVCPNCDVDLTYCATFYAPFLLKGKIIRLGEGSKSKNIQRWVDYHFNHAETKTNERN